MPGRQGSPLTAYVPDEADLRRWSTSHWLEYQAWLYHHDYLSRADWRALRRESRALMRRPPISIVTPVYNTEPRHLYECVQSVLAQAYEHWQLCLVDDASTRPETRELLQALAALDPRIRLHRLASNGGVCVATNRAVDMAKGDYIAFLDHDDRLHPAALYHVARAIEAKPKADILYTDRDMIGPEGYRYMHLFKPDWSPETLYSGNYLFHLVVYRKRLLRSVGGLRGDYDGSQDFDLILRAMERDPVVAHIPRILYHWREHQGSVASPLADKEYVFDAGLRALQDAVRRRGLAATVEADERGNPGQFRVRPQPPADDDYHVLQVPALHPVEGFRAWFARALAAAPARRSIILVGPGVAPLEPSSHGELVSWLQLPGVGIVTGKVVDGEAKILHAGLVLRPDGGHPLPVYEGFPEHAPSYLSVTGMVRNVSLAHPYCLALRRELLEALGDGEPALRGPALVFDLCLRAARAGWRTLYTPYARYGCPRGQWQRPGQWPDQDRILLWRRWRGTLEGGDPYYNPNLSLDVLDMGLDPSPPPMDRDGFDWSLLWQDALISAMPGKARQP